MNNLSFRSAIGTAILVFSGSSLYAQQLLGVTASQDSLYYVSQKTIYCVGMKLNKPLFQKNLDKDTVLFNRLHTKACRVFGIKTDSARLEASEALKHMQILNITAAHHQVYAAIRFSLSKALHARCYFAIVRLTPELAYCNFYLLVKPGVPGALTNFNIPPFHEMQFPSANTVLIPALVKDNKLDYVCFLLNDKTISMERSHSVATDIAISKQIAFMSPENVLLNPLIYAIPVAGQYCFYKYPYPVLYRNQDDLLADVYQLRAKVDIVEDGLRNFAVNLKFVQAQQQFGFVTVAAGSTDSLVYMIACKEDVSHTALISYHIATKAVTIKQLGIPLKGHYFLFRGRRLIVLDMSAGTPSILQTDL